MLHVDRLSHTSSRGRSSVTELQFSSLPLHTLKNAWCPCYSKVQKHDYAVKVLVRMQRKEEKEVNEEKRENNS